MIQCISGFVTVRSPMNNESVKNEEKDFSAKKEIHQFLFFIRIINKNRLTRQARLRKEQLAVKREIEGIHVFINEKFKELTVKK